MPSGAIIPGNDDHQTNRADLWVQRRAILAGVLAAAAAASWLTLRASLPAIDGHAALPGLAARVSIERDAAGVPTLTGRSRVDLARGIGVRARPGPLFSDGPAAARRGRRTIRAPRARAAAHRSAIAAASISRGSARHPGAARCARPRTAGCLRRRRQCRDILLAEPAVRVLGTQQQAAALERRGQHLVRRCHVPAVAGFCWAFAAAARLAARDAARRIVAISGSRRARVGLGHRRQPRPRAAASRRRRI